MPKSNAPRTDKKKNIGKVAEILIENPNKTARELASETGMGASTANRAKQELAQTGTKDETIAYIVGSSKDRLKRIQIVLDRFVEESEAKQDLERGDTALIKEIAKDDLQRITILGGTVTDEKGGLRSVKDLTDDELLAELEPE